MSMVTAKRTLLVLAGREHGFLPPPVTDLRDRACGSMLLDTTPTRGGKAFYAGWGGGDYSNSNNKLWVALAEKAYAQINESGWLKKGEDHNSYLKDKGIGSNYGNPNTARKASEAMEHIMGFDAKIEDKDDINAGSFTKNDLIQLVNSDNLVSVELGPHHYAIIGYDSSTKKFNLYDPFGSYQHKTWDELVASLRNGFQYTIT